MTTPGGIVGEHIRRLARLETLGHIQQRTTSLGLLDTKGDKCDRVL